MVIMERMNPFHSTFTERLMGSQEDGLSESNGSIPRSCSPELIMSEISVRSSLVSNDLIITSSSQISGLCSKC